ncbi:MAG: hypothetical protein ACREN6_17785 [Gemmatimonadaceae bacterium]
MADQRPAPGSPALSRAALERVLARAAQLQGTTGEGDDAGAMNEAQVVELGKEVGLSPEVLRQALAEERSRTLVPEESGMLSRLAGTSTVSAARTVPGAATAVLAALDGWMQRSESLEVRRRFADQLVWEARRDFFSAVRRVLNASSSGLELAAASSVTAIVADVAPGQSHVRVVADFRSTRNDRVVKGLLGGLLFTVFVGGPLLAIGIAPVLAAIPAVIAGAVTLFVTWSKYRRLIERAQVALEQALDRLEFASDKPATTAQVLLDAIIGPPRPPK